MGMNEYFSFAPERSRDACLVMEVLPSRCDDVDDDLTNSCPSQGVVEVFAFSPRLGSGPHCLHAPPPDLKLELDITRGRTRIFIYAKRGDAEMLRCINVRNTRASRLLRDDRGIAWFASLFTFMHGYFSPLRLGNGRRRVDRRSEMFDIRAPHAQLDDGISDGGRKRPRFAVGFPSAYLF
mmetsp:Transcript_28587/g.84195  ORF Transcript_28587/g.84195 Transcript_28587/m.84195 type:complete len:180 (-) Transcript_28587:1755-2294(-)